MTKVSSDEGNMNKVQNTVISDAPIISNATEGDELPYVDVCLVNGL